MSIQVNQSSTYVGDGRWKWAVWLAGDTDELDAIDHVIYTLHPSFPNPIREIRARRDGFRLTSSGWGTFRIYIEIIGQDGARQQLSHDLNLETPAEAEDGSESGDESDSMSAQRPPIRGGGLKGLLRDSFKLMVAEVAEHLPVTTVFISGGVADSEAVRQLRVALASLNVNILSSDDVPAGVPAQAYISHLIARVDIAIFVISGRPSLWLSQEIEAAKRAGKRIVPVLTGSEAELPDALSGYQSMHIKSLDNLAGLAKGILGD